MDRTAPFVRSAMIPQAPPPRGETGLVHWVRANLFATPLDAVLTLLSVVVVWQIAAGIGPWFLNAVWNASSLAQCREILAGEQGACLAVIRDRWHQLLFGFYPSDLYWRPTLALILMLVALAPILFAGAPRRLLWFSAVYPALAYWLLWGGTIWFPALALAGFAVGYGAFRAVHAAVPLIAVPAAALAAVLWWVFLTGPLSEALHAILPVGLTFVRSDSFGGFMLSTIIGVTGIALSLPIGILLALGRKSDMLLIKTISVGFIEFIRGVPLITLLFTASLLLNYFLPPGTNFDIVLRVVIMVTLFAAAYMAEVIRGGLAALPRGQYEAADSLGLDYWRSMRLIILPQALKISIPGIVNNFIGLFKDTTLVVFIGLLDPLGLTTAIRADSAWNGIFWELYIFVGACFFIFCFGMSRYSMHLEARLKTDHR